MGAVTWADSARGRRRGPQVLLATGCAAALLLAVAVLSPRGLLASTKTGLYVPMVRPPCGFTVGGHWRSVECSVEGLRQAEQLLRAAQGDVGEDGEALLEMTALSVQHRLVEWWAHLAVQGAGSGQDGHHHHGAGLRQDIQRPPKQAPQPEQPLAEEREAQQQAQPKQRQQPDQLQPQPGQLLEPLPKQPLRQQPEQPEPQAAQPQPAAQPQGSQPLTKQPLQPGKAQPKQQQPHPEEQQQPEQPQDRQAQPREQQPPGEVQVQPPGEVQSPYFQALSACKDLACLTEAAALERSPGQYRFPHFFIKCATTSLYHHLKDHPELLSSKEKEPEFFTNACKNTVDQCPADAIKGYIKETLRLPDALAAGLRKGAYEASTHYGRRGQLLAASVRRTFPWLKVIISLREPISRALSMLAHTLDKKDSGCLKTKADAFDCLKQALTAENYTAPLMSWLDAFPREQIYLIQYEHITSSDTMADVLHSVKRFLDIDQELPNSDLGMRNTREYHLQRKGKLQEGEEADGWHMLRWQYKKLVDIVRPDAEQVARLADKYGLADGRALLRAWEAEWQATLDACGAGGSCLIFPN